MRWYVQNMWLHNMSFVKVAERHYKHVTLVLQWHVLQAADSNWPATDQSHRDYHIWCLQHAYIYGLHLSTY